MVIAMPPSQTPVELIRKYNVPGPRYTSYPTVPYWEANPLAADDWIRCARKAFAEGNDAEGISLYVHLPFCENLCTFCGCHKKITRNHAAEDPYIDAVLKEWSLHVQALGAAPNLRELHLGGGTPTFFSPANLKRLVEGILVRCAPPAGRREFSFEGHPNNTTAEHLRTLAGLGFRRVSFGVQDYDPVVQETIRRIQPFENVRRVTEAAREAGYESVGHDLVFGLPRQTLAGIAHTLGLTGRLRPDRISSYGYAHVPWVKGTGQRGFDEKDLPRDAEKRALYEEGRRLLEAMGYSEVGMDHFALPTDDLWLASREGRLHRNFMGYTPTHTRLMIGLGMSAISDAWYAFAQNEKSVEDYMARVAAGGIPIFRGHLLDDEDLVIRRHILNLMCRFETSWADPSLRTPGIADAIGRLGEMEADGLVERLPDGLRVTPAGRPFVRNVCMAFDLRLQRRQPQTRLFSSVI